MIRHFCDRCGTGIEGRRYLFTAYKGSESDTVQGSDGFRHMTLCSDCLTHVWQRVEDSLLAPAAA